MKTKLIILLSVMLLAETTGLILMEQKKNRDSLYTEVIINGNKLELNVDEFIEYSRNKGNYDSNDITYDDSTYTNLSAISDNADTGDNLRYLGEFKLTGYCDCEECQEEWVGTTALGYAPEEEWTVAVDPDVIPLGSYIWINGHRYFACDVGGMINENHVDIFCGSHEECYSDFCNGYADVYLEVNE